MIDRVGKLIFMDSVSKQESETSGHEFGYYVFEKLLEIEIQKKPQVKEQSNYTLDDAIPFENKNTFIFNRLKTASITTI